MKMPSTEDEISKDFIHLSQLVNTPEINFGPLVKNILKKCTLSSDYQESATPNLISLAMDYPELRELLEEIGNESKNDIENDAAKIANQILTKAKASTSNYRTR